MKKEKEICASCAVTCQTTEVMAKVHGGCIAKMEKHEISEWKTGTERDGSELSVV